MESTDVSTKQRRIAELARIHPEVSFTSLAHHIDLRWLYEAYQRTRKDAAVGVDGQTAEEYAKDLGGNLRSLLERAKVGNVFCSSCQTRIYTEGYGELRLVPSVFLPSKTRCCSVRCRWSLEPLYEQEFLDCSYGFRPGRSAHDALQALWDGLMKMGGGWIIDLGHSESFSTLLDQEPPSRDPQEAGA